MRLRQRWALVAVTALSLALNLWDLGRNGLGNLYYAAGVRSMAHNWHNFWFNSFDPGGFISVDKPPVAQWIDTVGVRVLGFNSWGLLMPSGLLAGAATVAMLWCIVRRQVGWPAATVAAVVLALSPINVAVNRVNLPDPFLVLFLTVAAWAVLRSLEGPRVVWWVLGAGVAIGLAFNTKLLVAAIPVPAMGITVLAAGSGWWLLRVRNAAVFAVTSVVVSLSWLLVVDGTSPARRPYVGGSTNNTVWNQAFGYNGIKRLSVDSAAHRPRGVNPLRGFSVLFGGSPGPWRMFNAVLGPQIAWLLPLAAVGLVVGLVQQRGQRSGLAVVGLFAGWLLTFVAVFSEASGTFHSYYVAVMMPGVAVLVGVGGVALAGLARGHRWWLGAAAVGVAGTVAVQRLVADRDRSFYGWTTTVLVVGVVVGVLAIAASFAIAEPRRSSLLTGGLGVLLAAALVAPAGWSVGDVAHPTLNPTMPAAGPRQSLAAVTFGAYGSSGDPRLASWLRAQQGRVRWDLVVTNGPGAAGLIADQSVSVLALGGFEGTDPAATVRSFAGFVRAGEVRFVEPNTRFGGITGFGAVAPPARIMCGVIAACPPVRATTRNHLPRAYSGQLYDCRGRARQLVAQA